VGRERMSIRIRLKHFRNLIINAVLIYDDLDDKCPNKLHRQHARTDGQCKQKYGKI
jgi:hypothetical protein